MGWKEAEIKRLKEHIIEYEEWLEERAEFSKKLRQWMADDRAKIAELQSR